MSEQQTTAGGDEATNAAARDEASVAESGPELDRAETGIRRRKRVASIAGVVAVAAVV